MPGMATPAEGAAAESLPLSKQWLYAIGQMGWSALTGLVGQQLVYFYLPPTDTATEKPIFPIYVTQARIFVVMNVVTLLATAGRLWDAVTDPVIAGLSDRLEHRKGRRIPFLAAGGLPAAIFCALLFVPVVQRESVWNVVWLALVQMLFYLFITLYVTPYFCLVSELGHTAQERLDLSTWISITFLLGTVLASSAPTIGGIFGLDALGSLHSGIAVICIISVVCMYVPVLAIDEKRYCASQPSQIGIIAALKHCVSDPHFRPYVAAEFSNWFAVAIISTGMPYYLTVLVRLSDKYLVVVISTIGALSLLLYYPTNRLAKRFKKKPLVLVAFAMLLVVFLSIFFLGWPNLPPMVQILGLGSMASLPLAILGVLPNSILSDIAARNSRKTGLSQEGMYFAARAFLNKLGQSCGIMVFASLTNFGKDVNNDWGVRLSGLVGFACGVLALVAFSFYRENEVLEEEQQVVPKCLRSVSPEFTAPEPPPRAPSAAPPNLLGASADGAEQQDAAPSPVS